MKEEILTSLQIGQFLQDFEQHATFEIIEGAKEKDEIIKIAKAKGIDLKDNTDLAGFKAIYGFTDKANARKDLLPEKELLKAFPSIISKPVNIAHDRRYVIGHIIDYRYQQKTKTIIVYGVIYKSNFGSEWKRAKRDFMDGKLSASWEIHAPHKYIKKLPNGIEEIHNIEMAGMAILFRDEEPAAEGANVLSLARKKMDTVKDLDLVYASKYKKEDIIIADHFKDEVEQNLKKFKEEEEEKAKVVELTKKTDLKVEEKKEEVIEPEKKEEVKAEVPKEPEAIINPTITCSNCQEKLDLTITSEISHGLIKCSKCFAILNGQTGEMIHPPQIKNFRMACPSCRMNNWLILSSEENKTKLKCSNEACNKIYEIEFKVKESNELLDKMKFVYISSVSCLQCGRSISISTTSHAKNVELTCPKCGLVFSYDITKGNKDRQITKITEIIKDESSEKGGEEKVKKPDEKEKKETTEVDEKVKETEKPKEEVKVDAPKEETPKEEVEEPIKEEEKAEKPKIKASLEIPKKSSEETQETKSYIDIIKAENELETTGKSEPVKVELATEIGDKIIDSEIVLPKKSAIRKAVKKIMDLKKEVKALNKASNVAYDIIKTKNQEKEDKLKTAIKKVASQLIKANAEIKKIKLEADEKIELYKVNAKEILKRREELGKDYGKDLSDKDILDDDKFETASLRKENSLLKASKETADDIVGEKKEEEGNDELKDLSKVITAKAFPKKAKKGDNNV